MMKVYLCFTYGYNRSNVRFCIVEAVGEKEEEIEREEGEPQSSIRSKKRRTAAEYAEEYHKEKMEALRREHEMKMKILVKEYDLKMLEIELKINESNAAIEVLNHLKEKYLHMDDVGGDYLQPYLIFTCYENS